MKNNEERKKEWKKLKRNKKKIWPKKERKNN